MVRTVIPEGSNLANGTVPKSSHPRRLFKKMVLLSGGMAD